VLDLIGDLEHLWMNLDVMRVTIPTRIHSFTSDRFTALNVREVGTYDWKISILLARSIAPEGWPALTFVVLPIVGATIACAKSRAARRYAPSSGDADAPTNVCST